MSTQNTKTNGNVNTHIFENGHSYSYTANSIDAEAIEDFLCLKEVQAVLVGYLDDEEPYDRYHAVNMFAESLASLIRSQFPNSSLASRAEELMSLIEDESPFFTMRELVEIAVELYSDYDDFDLEEEQEGFFQPGLEGWDLMLSPALR